MRNPFRAFSDWMKKHKPGLAHRLRKLLQKEKQSPHGSKKDVDD